MTSNWWGNNIPRRNNKTRTPTDEWHNRNSDNHSHNFNSNIPRRTTMDKRSNSTQHDSTLSKSKSSRDYESTGPYSSSTQNGSTLSKSKPQRDKDGTKESFQSTQNDSTASSGKLKWEEKNKSSKSTQHDVKVVVGMYYFFIYYKAYCLIIKLSMNIPN